MSIGQLDEQGHEVDVAYRRQRIDNGGCGAEKINQGNIILKESFTLRGRLIFYRLLPLMGVQL